MIINSIETKFLNFKDLNEGEYTKDKMLSRPIGTFY